VLGGGGASTGALALLAGLPDDQRAAIRGRVLEDRDYRELAATLLCSESVVRQRVSRGLRVLRDRLEQTR
jgi:DNA-directed RNA polymerase specialized sigma24 family protein